MDDRFPAELRKRLAREIEQAQGNEVLFVGRIDPETSRVCEVKVAARGDRSQVPALRPHMEQGDVVIHNHPSGILIPSGADLEVASQLGQTGIGFWIVNNDVSDCYAVTEPLVVVPKRKLSLDAVSGHLSEHGSFSRSLQHFESRQPQVDLVRMIAQGFNEDGVVMAEAGTGVGKSFAYLVPALLWCQQNAERVVVSTATINLQQQLVEKDLPLVQRVLGTQVKAVLVKGRRNYLCPTRLADEVRDLGQDPDLPADQIRQIAEWAQQTKTGDVAELGFLPDDTVWSRVCSDQDLCAGARCSQNHGCFLSRARREAAGAGLLIVNHHLLFADLSLRMQGFGIDGTAVLPPFQRIVFDEAHHLERSATSYFSQEYRRAFLLKMLGRLYRQRRGRPSGLILTLQGLGTESIDFGRYPALTSDIADRADRLNLVMLTTLGSRFSARLSGPEGREIIDTWQSAVNELQAPILELVELNKRLAEAWEEEAEVPVEVWELKSISRKLESIGLTLRRWCDFERDPSSVYWMEKARDHRGQLQVDLNISPLVVSDLMNRAVFQPYGTVVLTSATLSIGGDFQFWAGRVGWNLVDESRRRSGIFPSPFDYANRVVLGVPADFPTPDDARYQESIESFLTRLLVVSGGRALVLFTSYESLRQTYSKVQPAMAARGIPVYRQGDDERSRLLTRFRDEVSSVLFATDSFWEGVDSPGETLKVVVVCRLPFRVPTDPVISARMEQLDAQGIDSFRAYSLPEAVTRFKQGFGRLIRRHDDSGAVVVLDTRLLRKPYGQLFLRAIPETRRSFLPADDLLLALGRFLDQ